MWFRRSLMPASARLKVRCQRIPTDGKREHYDSKQLSPHLRRKGKAHHN